MALPIAADLVFVLAIAVGIVAAVTAGVGTLYGRLARGWGDERATRGTNLLAIGPAGLVGAVVGIAVWNGGTESASVLEAILVGLGAAVTGGLAAGVVGAATITGVVTARPDLPGIDDAATVRRQYARYLAGILFVVLLFVPAVELATRGGPVGITAVVAVAGVGLWAGGPRLRSLTATTRRPTAAERDRLEALREAAALEVRAVRVTEADGRVSTELLGAPGARTLFVSRGALDALEDETLTAMLVARREQASQYERPALIAVLVATAAPLVGWGGGELSAVAGLGGTAVAVLAGFALLRRLRYRADDRAAAALGADAVADAFERACEAAGFDIGDLEDAGGRRWLSPRPSMAARIERLRDTDADAGGRSG